MTGFQIKSNGFTFVAPLVADTGNIVSDFEGNKWVAAKAYKNYNPYLISVEVEVLGDLCKNPNFHPKKFNEDEGFGKLLKSNGRGCDKFKTDSNYSVLADVQK